MICKQCGENLPDSARVCDSCGSRVIRTSSEQAVFAVASSTDIKERTVKRAGVYFKEIFSCKDFFTVVLVQSIALSLTLFAVIAAGILSLFTSELLSLGASTVVQSIASVFFCVILWKLYKKAKSVSEPEAADFKNLVKWCRIYVQIQFGVQIIGAVISVIVASLASGLTFAIIIGEGFDVAIGLLPVYGAYKLTESFEHIATNDYVVLESTSYLNVFAIIYCIGMALLAAISLIACLISFLFFIITIMLGLQAFLSFKYYSWLRFILQKAKTE